MGDGNCDLAGEGNPCVCQFLGPAELIYGFEQSSGTPMYLDRQTGHPICEQFLETHNALSVSTVLSVLAPC